MNTDKMIPMDFSRNITPFVIGDVMSHAAVGSFTLKTDDQVNNFNNGKLLDGDYYIVSFADRPNTGTQPVGDDVVVNVIYDDDHAYPVDKNSKGSRMGKANWDLLLPISIVSWKPNHAALLAKFKEQGANTMTKLAEQKRLDHAVALTIESLEDNPDGQVLNEDWLIDHLTDKPVFTQEMADDFKIPKVGSDVEIFDAPSGSYVKCEIICHHKKALFIAVDGWDAAVSVADDSLFRPIDNRTEKQKLMASLWDCIEQNDGDLNESSIDAFRSDLLSKFTITLNKE